MDCVSKNTGVYDIKHVLTLHEPSAYLAEVVSQLSGRKTSTQVYTNKKKNKKENQVHRLTHVG